MWSLFKNHNMMMPVDFGDNPYTIKAEELSPKPTLEASPSKWDWNKLFVPMQEAMKPKNSKETEAVDDFKYASPFASRTDDCGKQPALNPHAKEFTFDSNTMNNNTESTDTPPVLTEDTHKTFMNANVNHHHNNNNANIHGMNSSNNTGASPFAAPFGLNVNAASFKMNMCATIAEEADESDKIDVFMEQKKVPEVLDDDTVLAMHGFKKLGKMKNSLQGAIYFGETIPGHELSRKLNIPAKKKRRVVIKKVVKELHQGRISKQDGMNIIVDEDVVKEAIILHHLTVDNNPAGSAICKLISFFESSNAFYIVSEYCGKSTLRQFADQAHKYIQQGKLAVSHWKKICKYVAWQIAATLYWMHTDMNCAHLDLTLDNIVVSNGSFIVDGKSGKVTIDRNLSCKIIDFGLSEIFHSDSKPKAYFCYDADEAKLGMFHVNNKYSIASNHQCPRIFEEEVYDARKADIWSLGVVMFYLSFGMYPYEKQLASDSGFWSIKNNKLSLFLDLNHLSHLYNSKLVALMSGCLCVDEEQRFNIGKVITNVWFKQYFKRYADKMQEQSKQQLEKNKQRQQKMENSIPYYKPTENTHW